MLGRTRANPERGGGHFPSNGWILDLGKGSPLYCKWKYPVLQKFVSTKPYAALMKQLGGVGIFSRTPTIKPYRSTPLPAVGAGVLLELIDCCSISRVVGQTHWLQSSKYSTVPAQHPKMRWTSR